MKQYLITSKLFYNETEENHIDYTDVFEFDLCSVVPSCSGPKRAQDKVALNSMKSDFQQCLTSPMGFKV